MASLLLETKLFVPRPRRGIVARGRLRERLSRGTESRLTLISAPAGFGKTTLLAEWLASRPGPETAAAWLSLDPADAQTASFWAYVISALQTTAPGVGATPLALLEGPQPPSPSGRRAAPVRAHRVHWSAANGSSTIRSRSPICAVMIAR